LVRLETHQQPPETSASNLPRRAQAPTPFHILWRHPDNASFTEQGDEYLSFCRNVVKENLKVRAPSGGNVIAVGLYISHQISSESFTVFYRRTSGNTVLA